MTHTIEEGRQVIDAWKKSGLVMQVGVQSASLPVWDMAREMINLVPTEYKEAAIALGSTRFEMIWKVVLPYARSGIFAGFMLALGRALGETMAVTMVIGNSNNNVYIWKEQTGEAPVCL